VDVGVEIEVKEELRGIELATRLLLEDETEAECESDILREIDAVGVLVAELEAVCEMEAEKDTLIEVDAVELSETVRVDEAERDIVGEIEVVGLSETVGVDEEVSVIVEEGDAVIVGVNEFDEEGDGLEEGQG
jgi:hypothetical protein